MKRYMVLVVCIFAITPLYAENNFRVAWRNIATGTVRHGAWISEAKARMRASDAAPSDSDSQYWVEEKKNFLFIHLFPKRIPLHETRAFLGNRFSNAVPQHRMAG